MRDVDEALARAYGFTRLPAADHPHVPPPPHLTPTNVFERASASIAPAPTWPAAVLTLERRYGDRFARLAEVLIAARDRQHRKLFLFTSCHRAEGRTTLTLTLARALAEHSKRGANAHRRRRPRRPDARPRAGFAPDGRIG